MGYWLMLQVVYNVSHYMPMLLQNALSGARSESRTTHNMTFRAINCVNPLAVDVNASIHILNGYSLFDWCNAALVFELTRRRARKIVPIYVVIKSLCRIMIIQFYASHLSTIFLADFAS
jgi:hypothetical protein